MANLEIELNPHKSIRRKDLDTLGKMISKASKDKKVDVVLLKVASDKIGAIMFPFQIVEK